MEGTARDIVDFLIPIVDVVGAVVIGTAVSPMFKEIGKLGAIAAIRTALNYFLAQELVRERRVVGAARRGTPGDGGVRPQPVTVVDPSPSSG
jgi:hypothetical protein